MKALCAVDGLGNPQVTRPSSFSGIRVRATESPAPSERPSFNNNERSVERGGNRGSTFNRRGG